MRIAAMRREIALFGAEIAARARKTLPGALGAGSLVWAGHLVWPPLAFAVAGAFLLMIDRDTP